VPVEFENNEIRACVERACNSPFLAGSPRLQTLLRYLADAALAGEAPKETIIGVTVFGRPADYDPQADAIVRTEVRRLRLKLFEFYAGPGAAEPIRIDIPKGRYSLRFEPVRSAATGTAGRPHARRLAIAAITAAASIAIGPWLASRWWSTTPKNPAHTTTAVAGVQDLFLEGRRLWSTRQKSDLLKSIELFQRAAAMDPDYAWDYIGMADSYGALAANGHDTPDDTLPVAEAAARRAVALSPRLAEAHASLGYIYYCKWKWKDAERELKEARRLNPALPIALFRSALVACALGHFDEAVRTLKQEEIIDPFSPLPANAIVEIEFYRRDHDGFLQATRAARQRFPGVWYAGLVRDFVRQGRVTEARAAEGEWKAHGASPQDLLMSDIRIRSVNDVAGARAEFERARRLRLLDLSHRNTASFLAELGDRAGALDEMEKSLAAHEPDLCSLQWEPSCDLLRSDVRFVRMMNALGLPPAERASGFRTEAAVQSVLWHRP